MRIGFVAEPYEESKASGMGHVVMEVMKGLAAHHPGAEFIIYSSKPISRDLVRGEYQNVLIPRGFVKKWFWALQFKGSVDVLLYMVPMLPLWLPKRIKTVLLCQELCSQKTRPEGFYDAIFSFVRDYILLAVSMKRATKVIVPSQATADDVVKYYGIPASRIALIPNGFQELSGYKDAAPTLDASMKPFFFFAGKAKSRKNLHGIIAGFIEFKKRTGSDAKLVIAGDASGGYYESLVASLENAGMRDQAFFVGYISAAQLYAYYTNAIAFLFPSFNEGFGIPLVEAMSLGVPIITSNISAMPEIVGDAAALIDPYDASDIAGAMERVSSDGAYRATLISRGLERAKNYSWPKTVEGHWELVRSLV